MRLSWLLNIDVKISCNIRFKQIEYEKNLKLYCIKYISKTNTYIYGILIIYVYIFYIFERNNQNQYKRRVSYLYVSYLRNTEWHIYTTHIPYLHLAFGRITTKPYNFGTYLLKWIVFILVNTIFAHTSVTFDTYTVYLHIFMHRQSLLESHVVFIYNIHILS